MPAWMTSLLREEIPVPIPFARSATITAWPRWASARATASPTTPAPTTRAYMAGPRSRALSRDRHLRRGRAHVGVDVVFEALEVLVEHVDEALGGLAEGGFVGPGLDGVEDVRL